MCRAHTRMATTRKVQQASYLYIPYESVSRRSKIPLALLLFRSKMYGRYESAQCLKFAASCSSCHDS